MTTHTPDEQLAQLHRQTDLSTHTIKQAYNDDLSLLSEWSNAASTISNGLTLSTFTSALFTGLTIGGATADEPIFTGVTACIATLFIAGFYRSSQDSANLINDIRDHANHNRRAQENTNTPQPPMKVNP